MKLRGKKHCAPRPRSIARLKRISALALSAANFMGGHILQPTFRRELTRELNQIKFDLQRVMRKISGEE